MYADGTDWMQDGRVMKISWRLIALISVIGAIAVAMTGNNGWGWLLALAFLIAIGEV